MCAMTYAAQLDGISLDQGGLKVSEEEIVPKFENYIRNIGGEVFDC